MKDFSKNEITDTLLKKAADIKILALDVDGILSDGKIIYDGHGVETKAFYVQDGVGIKALQKYGIDVAIITGRTSPMVKKRADELGIMHIIQGRDDKITALKALLHMLNISVEQCAYMGDDLPDIRALQYAGLSFSVPNAHTEVLTRVDFITQKNGGEGAVREVCDFILKAQNHYEDYVSNYINSYD